MRSTAWSDGWWHTTDQLRTILAASTYPLQGAFGQLGLAMTVAGVSDKRRLAEQALEAGSKVGQLLAIDRANLLLLGDPGATAEIFFC